MRLRSSCLLLFAVALISLINVRILFSPSTKFEEIKSPLPVLVLPSVLGPTSRPSRVKSIGVTWGASSLISVHFIPDVETATPFDTLIRALFLAITLPGPYYYFCNDHTYLLPKNLVAYASTLSPSLPIYAGHRLRNPSGIIFNSGAAGYILNLPALKILLACPAPTSTNDAKNPSLWLSRCLSRSSVNALVNPGPEMFHMYSPGRTETSSFDKWAFSFHPSDSLPVSSGSPFKSVISPHSISFHYVSSLEGTLIHNCIEGLTCKIKDEGGRKEDQGGLSFYSNGGGGEDLVLWLRSNL